MSLTFYAATVCVVLVAIHVSNKMQTSNVVDKSEQTTDSSTISVATTLFNEDPPTRPNLIWMAPFQSGGGYCSEATAFVLSVSQKTRHLRIKIDQHGDGVNMKYLNGIPLEVRSALQAMASAQVLPADSVVVCHSEPGAWYPPRWPTSRCPPEGSLYTIGRTMFETDRLPAGWEERLNTMDEIWVPTEFARRIFEANGVHSNRLVVIGEPVDTSFFDPDLYEPLPLPGPSLGSNVTRFLSSFKWEERKGWSVLLDAFFAAFDNNSRTCLYILSHAYHSDNDLLQQIFTYIEETNPTRSLNSLPCVQLIDRFLSDEELAMLYKAVDVFVLPSRGEGWGRPHVEAMSMALPVIATNWSGPTEFMLPSHSYPLRIDGLVPVEQGAFKGHHWAEPSREHLKQLMLHVSNNKEEAKSKGKRARQFMIDRYGFDRMATEVLDHLDRISNKIQYRTQQQTFH
eukprot:GILJ01011408.1.p1 GENE.GILJ01011408.1~~GILJ01011408.1.p1  ORF type:complete len:455 (-),score=58.76 GILJ01011408.1:238-1602(-)